MSQCNTVYGTESISIEVEAEAPSPSRDRSFATTAMALFLHKSTMALLLLVVTFMVYIYHDNISKIIGSVSFSTKSGASSDGIVIANCAKKEDISCDAQYGCTSYEDDISRVISNTAKRWEDYTQYITDTTDVSIDGDVCIQSKFIENHLMCSDNCDEIGYNRDIKQANLCKNTFLDEMQSVLKPYRRSCIAALIAHQFASLCGRKYDIANTIEKATFLWWKDRYKVGDSWNHADCPYFI